VSQFLRCAYQNQSPKSRREYLIPCEVLKEMPNGRLKVLVKGKATNIRYVTPDRVVDQTIREESGYESGKAH
jgi:hypothetical protein